MTKSDLIKLVSDKTLFNVEDVKEVVECVFTQIGNTLKDNRQVKIAGFGTFYLKHQNARKARNPKTGEEIFIESKYLPKFKPSKQLKELVSMI